MIIRSEQLADHAGVFAINEDAFKGPGEARLVELLREQADPFVSLVAEVDGRVQGHIMFSPAALQEHPELKVMGLAPVAVSPATQGSGVGSALVRAGIEASRELGVEVLIVLGHSTYYPRFGFVPSVQFGIRSEYEVPDELFMVLELSEGVLAGKTGTMGYHPAFKEL
jgi:putative acetyltransferase